MLLKHIPSELHDRHPATGRDMYGTNDLDVALHNPIRPDSPSGVGHMVTVTCHGLLIKGKEAYLVATPDRMVSHDEGLTLRNLLTEVPMCFMNRASVIGFRAWVSSRVGIWRFQSRYSGHCEGGRGASMRILQLVHGCVNLR